MGRKRIVRVDTKLSFAAKVPDEGEGTLDYRVVMYLKSIRDEVGDEALAEFIKSAVREKFAGVSFPSPSMQIMRSVSTLAPVEAVEDRVTEVVPSDPMLLSFSPELAMV